MGFDFGAVRGENLGSVTAHCCCPCACRCMRTLEVPALSVTV